MTPEEAQLIFEGCFALVASCYAIGLGVGLIIRLIRSAGEK